MRVLSLLFIALGAVLLVGAVVAYRHDRQQIRDWRPVTATVDSVKVRQIPPSGINRGTWVAATAVTYDVQGRTVRAWIWEPVWARMSRQRASRDAEAARQAGTLKLLVDPVDDRHISAAPDDAVYYYRDAWQRAGLGMVLLLIGWFLRRKP